MLERTLLVQRVLSKVSDNAHIYLFGSEADSVPSWSLTETKQSLLSLASDFADLVTVTLSIPSSLHGAVIGTGGTTLNAVLGEEKLAHVQFGGGEDEDEVVIRGPKDEAERVKSELERIAEEAKNEEIINSHVSTSFSNSNLFFLL